MSAATLVHAQSFTPVATTTTTSTSTKPKVTLTTESYPTGQAASPDRSQYTGDSTRSIMEWEGSGHWGFKLRLDQPVSRPTQTKDMEAGAYYKVTPGLRVGGAVGLADKPQPLDQNPQDDQVAPRVKLETTLKF